ncbi:Uncharacterized protein TCM_038713 [Theobroma cacao]|uniref:DUF4216 domain-containing protein n=1 Tax=Theobroma cacao TaxID=3641 RepID=A0A061GQM8_THECC|nr:Uncharacterized protein TCM_038713 [Theobroma cacao]
MVVQHTNQINSRLVDMSLSPSHKAMHYKGFYVNGYKFHTLDYRENYSIMNSGVFIKGSCYNDYDHAFYGLLVNIAKLKYFGVNNQVVLFKCHWFDIKKGLRVDMFISWSKFDTT